MGRRKAMQPNTMHTPQLRHRSAWQLAAVAKMAPPAMVGDSSAAPFGDMLSGTCDAAAFECRHSTKARGGARHGPQRRLTRCQRSLPAPAPCYVKVEYHGLVTGWRIAQEVIYASHHRLLGIPGSTSCP